MTSTPMAPSSPSAARSGMVFTTVLCLVLLALFFPEMAPQALHGILWTGMGVLLIFLPPEVRIPRLWPCLVAGFLACSLIGFLSRDWFAVSPWRLDLESLGLNTGPLAFVQGGLAAETLAGFAVSGVTALFLLGHRVDSRLHHRIMLGFVLGVALWTLAALWTHHTGLVLGFFPNRNHSASLLVMATFAGMGCLAQAIRLKDPWKIVLSLAPICLFLGVLFTVSISRAGVLLVAIGFLAWISLTGLRQLRGHAGKAVILLLLALVGVFLIVDSKVKERLDKTVVQLEAPSPNKTQLPEVSIHDKAGIAADPNMDGRIAIYHDAWTMSRNENWTGVGPGQFARVFPQYRAMINAPNLSPCLHPESDWLWMLTETGWPATLCLGAAVLVVFGSALNQARSGRARLLRMGSMVAAGMLCVHGLFDVPGHRVGLLWATVMLGAMALRPPPESAEHPAPRPSRHVWRAMGVMLILAGGSLLCAQWSGSPVLPSAKVQSLLEEVQSLYDADCLAYEQATAAGRDYQPDPGQDLLETALTRVEQALRIAPLEAHLHFVRGLLALHFDNHPGVATQAFAIQRRLDPTRVHIPLDQAKAWVIQNPQETISLWSEALRRAAAVQARLPKSESGIANTYQQLMQTAGSDEALSTSALGLASMKPDLLLLWSRSAPATLLDREMPRLLSALPTASQRKPLFWLWKGRGSKESAVQFAQSHPELGLTSP